jgi:hypothetical protein
MSRSRLGAEIALVFLMQFTVPADRAQRRPKGVGSIEFDRRSASDAYRTQLAHLAVRPIMIRQAAQVDWYYLIWNLSVEPLGDDARFI